MMFPNPGPGGGASHSGGGGGLSSGLVAYWKFDGNLNDSVGSTNLADVAADHATFVSGALNNCAKSDAAGGAIIGHADTSALRFGTPFTYSTWAKFSSLNNGSSAITLASKFASTALEFELTFDEGDLTFKARLFDQSVSTASVEDAHIGTISTGTWYNIVVTNNGSLLSIRTNAGTASTADSSGLGTIGGASDFWMFSSNFTGSPASSFSGEIDETGKWNRVLSGSEITTLYGGGTPPSLP